MARRPSQPTTPQPAQLTTADKLKAITVLRRRLEDIGKFDPNAVRDRSDLAARQLSQAIAKTLTDIFGTDTVEARRYGYIAELDRAPWSMGEGPGLRELIKGFNEGKTDAIAVIEGIIKGFEEDIELGGATPAPPSTARVTDSAVAPSRRIFVVHGHDEVARLSVCRVLERLELEPIVLHEQTSQGDTIIEKLERYADVGFAVVLMTPDDQGGRVGAPANEQRPRARQNVVFELGYFIGKLGRSRVCALVKGEMELLSDVAGVVYTPLDPAGAWQMRLAAELKAARIPVDANKLFG